MICPSCHSRDTLEAFTGCSALVTGASSGFGVEFAKQLAPYAQHLVLVARRTERLEHLKKELEATHSQLTVHVRHCDLADSASIQALLDWIYNEAPAIDFLINNAGLGDHGLFEESDWKRVQAMLDVNIAALTRLTYSLLPLLRRQPGAAILNVSSSAGFIPLPGMAVYAATKAYVTSFSEALRIELRKSTVTVTALCPGPSPTEFGQIAARDEEDIFGRSPSFFKIPAPEVVRSGLIATVEDRPRIIPGWFVWLTMTLAMLLPMFVVRQLLRNRN